MSRKLRNKRTKKPRVNNDAIATRDQFVRLSMAWYNQTINDDWHGITEFDASPWLNPIAYRKMLQTHGEHHQAEVGKGVRDLSLRNVHTWGLESNEALGPIRAIYEHFNTEVYKYTIVDIQTPQMCVYYGNEKTQQGAGHYAWHQDSSMPVNQFGRVLSMSIALNDATEYEGGKLQLLTGMTPDGKPVIRTADLSKAGNAVIFPSQMFHRVTPITRGTRASCVTWLMGSYKSIEFF